MEYSLPQHKIRVLVEDLENKDKLVNGGVDKNLFIEVRTDNIRDIIFYVISPAKHMKYKYRVFDFVNTCTLITFINFLCDI